MCVQLLARQSCLNDAAHAILIDGEDDVRCAGCQRIASGKRFDEYTKLLNALLPTPRRCTGVTRSKVMRELSRLSDCPNTSLPPPLSHATATVETLCRATLLDLVNAGKWN